MIQYPVGVRATGSKKIHKDLVIQWNNWTFSSYFSWLESATPRRRMRPWTGSSQSWGSQGPLECPWRSCWRTASSFASSSTNWPQAPWRASASPTVTSNAWKIFKSESKSSIHRVVILNRGRMFAFQWRIFSPPTDSSDRQKRDIGSAAIPWESRIHTFPSAPFPSNYIRPLANEFAVSSDVTLCSGVGKNCITFFPFSLEACFLSLVLWLCASILCLHSCVFWVLWIHFIIYCEIFRWLLGSCTIKVTQNFNTWFFAYFSSSFTYRYVNYFGFLNNQKVLNDEKIYKNNMEKSRPADSHKIIWIIQVKYYYPYT